MSEFRRMITYLYLYERGVKSRNIGFAKIEKRDQRCLVEIHMKNTGCSLSPVPVYFYVQKKEHLVGISLGNCSLSRGIGEFKTVLQADNLQDSGYALDVVKGIYIPLTERIMLVSQWDDDEFHQEAFVTIKELAALEKSSSGSSDFSAKQPQPKQAANPAPETNLQSTADSSADAAALPTANTANNSDSQLLGMSAGNSPNQKISQPSGKIMNSSPNQTISQPSGKTMNSNPNQKISQPSGTPLGKQLPLSASQSVGQLTNNRPEAPASQSTEKPKDRQSDEHLPTIDVPAKLAAKNNSSPPINKQCTDESNASPKTDSSSPSSQIKAENRLNAAETTHPKAMDVLKALEAMPRPAQKMTNFRAINGNGQTTKNASALHNAQASEKSQSGSQTQSSHEKQTESVEDWSLRWRFILENFPVMTPFSGDENTICVRMELKDLRQLPRQFWYLGNNSFLLHGFFNYRYLILGMTDTLGMKRWFIGVPGVFQNPERVMAALFGFPEFRSEKPSPINTGQFGYWYRYLNELTQMPGPNKS